MNSKRVMLMAAGVVCVGGLGVILMYYGFNAALLSAASGLFAGPTRVATEISHNPKGLEMPPASNPAAGGSGTGTGATAVSVRTGATPPAARAGSVIRANNVVSVTLPLDEHVTIKVGQKLVAVPPLVGMGWNVEYDSTKLELAPGLDVSAPPAEGWSWTALKSGTTEIRFSSKVPPCDNKNQPCPDMPSFQAVLLIEIDP